ncbi:MAG: phosphoribosyltransferase family protein [Planctomycetaceae bacterium]
MPLEPYRQTVRSLIRSGLDLCFPPVCPGCDQLRSVSLLNESLPQEELNPKEGALSKPAILCEACQRIFAPLIAHRCPRCTAPVGPHAETSSGCPACQRDNFRFDRVISLGVYEGKLREAVLIGKQSTGQSLVTALTNTLWEREAALIREFSPEAIIAVPRHWRKEFRFLDYAPRSIAWQLGRQGGWPVRLNWLKRCRHRPDQAGLPRSARLTNLQGAFQANIPTRKVPARVLLVDDVLTTGTTMNTATSTLKKAGVGEVLAVVLARGIGI